jgi:hypothetical protein
MKKCKTCKYWDYQTFGIGNCSGITPSSMVIPIPNQPKGKPNGKLITVRSGLITDASFLKTTEDWNCKNWSRK